MIFKIKRFVLLCIVTFLSIISVVPVASADYTGSISGVISNITSSSAHLSMGGLPSGFDLYIIDVMSSGVFVAHFNSFSPEVDMIGLPSGTLCDAQIAPYNTSTHTEGVVTSGYSFTTLGPIMPVAPTVKVSNVSTTGFSASWSAVPNAVSYNIYDSSHNLIVNQSVLSFSLNSLTSNKDFSFYVSSVNGGLESPLTNFLVHTLTPPPPPVPTIFTGTTLPTLSILVLLTLIGTVFSQIWFIVLLAICSYISYKIGLYLIRVKRRI